MAPATLAPLHPSGHSQSKDDRIRHAHSYFEDSSNRFNEASHQGRDRDRPRPEPTPHWRNRPQLNSVFAGSSRGCRALLGHKNESRATAES